ncbi:hypothetical protein [Gordonibacter sp. An230]|nr:hypothetical protein [Gordonibacter sp. An230]
MDGFRWLTCLIVGEGPASPTSAVTCGRSDGCGVKGAFAVLARSSAIAKA